MSIFEKIFDIMNEYDSLLNNYNSTNINNKTDNNIDIFNDTFFKYIFENIHIKKNLCKKNDIQNNIQNDILKNDIQNDILKNDIQNDILKDDIQNDILKDDIQDDILKDDIQDDILKDDIQDDILKDDINSKIDDENEVLIFIKKIYKKIILKCHPDKNGNNEIFIKCKEYFENNFLIGILYIAYKINYQIPTLNNIIIKKILFEIRVIQEKIIQLKMIN